MRLRLVYNKEQGDLLYAKTLLYAIRGDLRFGGLYVMRGLLASQRICALDIYPPFRGLRFVRCCAL